MTVSGQLYESDLKVKVNQENDFQLSTCRHSLTIVPEGKELSEWT